MTEQLELFPFPNKTKEMNIMSDTDEPTAVEKEGP